MAIKRSAWILRIMVLILLAQSISPAVAADEATISSGVYRLRISGEASHVQRDQLYATLPAAANMLDRAIDSLSGGWAGMEADDRAELLRYYDPAGTGEIDEAYVSQVLDNFRQIRAQMTEVTRVKYETDSEMCDLMRLYYTDLIKIHICPYAAIEDSTERLARQWVHELAHIALRVVDRPYYQPVSTAYARLTPRGSWVNQLPLVGSILREIVQDDTLYHPDAYARYAAALVSEQPDESAPAPRPAVIPSSEGVIDMALLRHQNAVNGN